MTANTSLERRIAEHYAIEPPLRAPDRVLHAALETIETTKQRRGLLAPWRFTSMNAYTKVAAAAVVAVAVAAIGLWQLGGIGNTTPSPTPIPSQTAVASAAPAPPLTESFTSNMHGIQLAFPTGWAVTEATTPWTARDLPGFGSTSADLINDTAREDHLFLIVASQPLAGADGPAWADAVDGTEPCAASEPITVDGAQGRLSTCDPMRAVFWTDDRGYLVLVYRSPDEPALQDTYSTAWFEEVLAGVQVLPADAGTADLFVRPFDYVVPGAPVFDHATPSATSWEVRAPAYNDAGHPGGVIVQAIGGGHADTCDAGSAAVPLDPGATSVIQYLRTIPGLVVTDVSDTTVDGLPARQASVTATAGGADCPNLWVWGDQAEPFITGMQLRLIVVEVDAEHVVITVFGEPENPELPSLADAIVASFAFAATE